MKRYLGINIVFSVFFLIFLLDVSEAIAAEASSATIAAAGLENMGYQAQSLMLSQMKGVLISIAALVYIICIISAATQVVLSGEYKSLKWLILGPIIFYYFVDYTKETTGVIWKMGSFVDTQGYEQARRNPEGNVTPMKVSWFFHTYNVFVSSVVQNTIKVILSTENNERMLFTLRQRVLEQLVKVDPESYSGLTSLVQFTHSKCSKELENARIVSRAKSVPAYANTSAYKLAKDKYCNGINKKVAFINGPWRRFVASISDDFDRFKEDAIEDPVLTCKDLWEYQYVGARKAVLSKIERIEGSDIPETVDAGAKDKLWEDIKGHFEKEGVSPPTSDLCGTSLSTITVSPGEENIYMIANSLAGQVLKTAMRRDMDLDLMGSLYDRSGVTLEDFTRGEDVITTRQQVEESRRNVDIQNAGEYSHKTFTLGMTFPYLQGLGLYVLAVLYPFFALMILVPSKATFFLTWLGFWAWFKSWDIGWALVMVVDNIMWEFAPKSWSMEVATPSSTNINFDPVTVFETAFQGDYAVSLTTYYYIMAAMMTGVPIILAKIFLGAHASIAGTMANSMAGLSNSFGRSHKDYIMTKQGNFYDRAISADMVDTLRSKIQQGNMPTYAGIDRLKAMSEARTEMGQNLLDLSKGAALATGALTIGAPPAVKAGIIAGGLTLTQALKTAGINLKRSANSDKIAIRNLQAKLAFYEYGNDKTGKYQALNNIRAGTSLRREYGRVPDAPNALNLNIKNLERSLESSSAYTLGYALFSVPGAATKILGGK